MADIGALRELYAWMREEGILYARAGEFELRLEPLPPRVAFVPEQPSDPDEDERRSLETLLHSAGGDAGPILHALKRMRAA